MRTHRQKFLDPLLKKDLFLPHTRPTVASIIPVTVHQEELGKPCRSSQTPRNLQDASLMTSWTKSLKKVRRQDWGRRAVPPKPPVINVEKAAADTS
jgi:hypothetical protein